MYQFSHLVKAQLFLHNEPEHQSSKQHPREDEWEAAFEALAHCVPQLKELHIAYELLVMDQIDSDDSDTQDDDLGSENENPVVHYWQDHSTLFLPWRTFVPLLGLSKLQHFQCSDPKITGLDSEEFSSMAMAWRELRCFRISNPPRHRKKSQSEGADDGFLDHRALIAAAKYLCHLERLMMYGIDLSAAANDAFDRGSLIEGQSGHPLAILDFELITLRPFSSSARRSGSDRSRATSAELDSEVESESAKEIALRNVAGFIDTLFPNLTYFHLQYRYSGSYDEEDLCQSKC
ncbi:hypothetical protein BJ165DRAFT_140696 [Panaeolus papilionaceus]|nr:hypothetical protein BJ165DRAFT_140696 [Panaeolus papilionaceus]